MWISGTDATGYYNAATGKAAVAGDKTSIAPYGKSTAAITNSGATGTPKDNIIEIKFTVATQAIEMKWVSPTS